MFKLVVVLVVVALAGCSTAGGSGSSGSQVGEADGETSTPAVSGSGGEESFVPTSETAEPTERLGDPANEWASPDALTPFGLCRPDEVPTTGLTFFPEEPARTELEGRIPAFVHHGLYANAENELFRIDVTGTDADAVKAYTRDVLVCLDFAFSEAGGPAEIDGPGMQIDDSLPIFGAESKEDLVIQVAIEGLFGQQANPGEVADRIKELGAADPSATTWRNQLQDVSPLVTEGGGDDVPYIIDSIFHPKAKDGAAHQYTELQATKVWVYLSSLDGNVKGGLCRSSNRPSSVVAVKNVTSGTAVTLPLSDSQTYTSTYDLTVRGATTGQYRLGKRTGWPGWYRGFWDEPPVGSLHYCSVLL